MNDISLKDRNKLALEEIKLYRKQKKNEYLRKLKKKMDAEYDGVGGEEFLDDEEEELLYWP